MLKKLVTLYNNAVLFPERPEKSSEQLHLFFDEASQEWIGIPKTEIGEAEFLLLKTLYKFVQSQPMTLHTLARNWHDFLLFNGPMPATESDHEIRFIQFHIKGDEISLSEIEAALRGFFTEDIIIIWETDDMGIVIEEKKQISLTEEELIAMSETLESDFYVKVSFFIGKLYPFSAKLKMLFKQEQEFFTFGIKHLSNSRLFNYEHIFPAYLAYHLPDDLGNKVSKEIFELFSQDPELYNTIKVFLENNLNASMTAKKLYIHRNTLQYRLDKFTEKTGIGLKDFYGAFTVFLACQLFDQKRN